MQTPFSTPSYRTRRLAKVARATTRVLAVPVFIVLSVGAMLLILTRLYRN
jgi:hypothetical protein